MRPVRLLCALYLSVAVYVYVYVSLCMFVLYIACCGVVSCYVFHVFQNWRHGSKALSRLVLKTDKPT